MFRHKMVPVRFHAGQLDAFAGYLERQARKGWFLDYDSQYSIIGSCLFFKKGVPKACSYTVVLVPGASEWDDAEEGRVFEYGEMCKEYGWNLDGKYFRYVVFSNRNSQAVPVETDGRIWFDIVSREMWKKTFPIYAMLFSISAVMLLARGFHPEDFMFHNGDLLSMVLLFWLTIIMGGFLLWILRWFHVTRQITSQGGKIRPMTWRSVVLCNVVEDLAVAFWLLTYIGRGGIRYTIWYYLLLFVIVIVGIILAAKAFRLVKRFGDGDEKENNRVWVLVVLVISLLAGGGIMEAAIRIFPEVPLYYEETVKIGDLELPFMPDTYGYKWDDSYHTAKDSSILASRQKAVFVSDSPEQGKLTLTYYRFPVKMAYRLLEKRLIENKGNAWIVTELKPEQRDGVAIREYRYEPVSGFSMEDPYVYLLDNGSEILKLEFNGEPEDRIVDGASAALSARKRQMKADGR